MTSADGSHMSFQLVCADAVTFLRTLPDDSADLIIADPPYAIGFDGGRGWDRQWATESDYLAWCREWTYECARVLRPGRMLIVWGTFKSDTFLRYKLDVLNAFPTLTPQNEIIWSYNWGGRSPRNFARKHEVAWCYSKGPDFVFNADAVRVPRKMDVNMRTGELHEKGTIPTLIWEANNHTMSKDFVNWHPTTKNIDVLARMIKAYSHAGDTIVDPFTGSGSTAVAALRNDRLFLGCDIDAEYVARATGRIEASRSE